MSFDLASAVAEGKSRLGNKALALIILGASGSGKSRLTGTIGVPTLYLHTTTEEHGADSAVAGGSDVLPVCINKVGDKLLGPDESYARLLGILDSPDQILKMGIKAIVLDGLSELETIVHNSTAFKARVLKEKGGVTSYSGDIQRDFFQAVIEKLFKLRDQHGIHFVVTCILDVISVDNESLAIVEAKAQLYGFQMATNLTRWFPDIMVIGQMRNSNNEIKPRLQLSSVLSKETKDQKTKEVRKLHNIFVRITGADLSEAPSTLPANLALLAQVKRDGKYTPPEE